jgi:thiol-disulfide isomerase/thioredoxin
MLELPTFSRVLTHPREVFAQAAGTGRGVGALVLLLAFEFLLVHPSTAAGAIMRAVGAPLPALVSLWSAFVSTAITPVFAAMVAGIVLHYIARARHRKLDLWGAASALAYAWTPHTVVLAAGVLTASVGWDVPLLPQYGLQGTAITGWERAAHVLLVAAPPLAYVGIAVQTLLGPPVTPPPPSPRAGRAPEAAVLGLLAAGLVASLWGLHRHWAEVRPAVAGDPLPQFKAHGLHTPDVDSASLTGQVVLIDFWATWCAPCIAAMPHIEALYREMEPSGLRVLAVNVEPDNALGVEAFVRQQGFTMPVYVDDGPLQDRFHVHTFPTSFVIGKDGRVNKIYLGAAHPEELRSRLDALLAAP